MHKDWSGIPTHAHKSSWHWLKPKLGLCAVPMFWDAHMQSWRDYPVNINATDAKHRFYYVEPITWAIIKETRINKTTIT